MGCLLSPKKLTKRGKPTDHETGGMIIVVAAIGLEEDKQRVGSDLVRSLLVKVVAVVISMTLLLFQCLSKQRRARSGHALS